MTDTGAYQINSIVLFKTWELTQGTHNNEGCK